MNNERILESLETLSRCIGLLNDRCDLLQAHIKLVSDKLAEVLATT